MCNQYHSKHSQQKACKHCHISAYTLLYCMSVSTSPICVIIIVKETAVARDVCHIGTQNTPEKDSVARILCHIGTQARK
jgi:hypothetical protein